MQVFSTWYLGIAPYLYTLLAFIAVQLILGVAVALLINHDFQWKKLPEILAFYAPKILGWLCLELVAFVPKEVVDTIPNSGPIFLFTGGLSKIAFGLIALASLSAILSHLLAIGILPAGMVTPLRSFGIPSSQTFGSEALSDGAPKGKG